MKKISVRRVYMGFSGDIPFWKIDCPRCPWYLYVESFGKVFRQVDKHVEKHVVDGLMKIMR